MTILHGRLEDVINSSIENNENPAVVLIDMQEKDYCYLKDTPFQQSAFQHFQQVIRRQQELLSYARQEEMPIFVVELTPLYVRPDLSQYSKKDFTPGGNSTLPELSQRVHNYTGASLLKKQFSSAFKETDFEKHLRKKRISTLLLMGQNMYVCVLSTAQDARALGFQVITAPTVMDLPILDKYGKRNLPLFYVEHCRTYDDEIFL